MSYWESERLGRPPAETELEVSLFGPGYGEAVVVHLGNNDWLIVDSCIDQQSKKVIPSEYLARLGVDLASVRLIVATHWHDDHVRGLASIVERCSAAQFICSAALQRQEFLTLVTAQAKDAMIRSSGVAEFNNILYGLKERWRPHGESASPALQWAVGDRLLWKRQESPAATVTAMSPSDQVLTHAFQRIAIGLPEAGNEKMLLPLFEPNDASVVLWLSVDETHVLLGADLEHSANRALGWFAVLSCASLPSGKAEVFKVPHHGSGNAQCEEVWSELLEPEPHAALCSFVKGNVALPTQQGISWLCAKSPHVYLTGRDAIKRRRRTGPVQRTLREMGVNPRLANPPFGHVRLRKSLTEPQAAWRSEVFGNAGQVCG